jgi:hypothetical protein
MRGRHEDTKGCGVSEPYRFIKNLQQAIRKPNGRKSTVKDMLVLSQQNDPFYAGNGARETRRAGSRSSGSGSATAPVFTSDACITGSSARATS